VRVVAAVPFRLIMIVATLWSGGFAAVQQSRPDGLTSPQKISADLSVDNWALDQIDGTRDGSFTFQATGAGVNIYVIDSGVNVANVDFGGRATAIGNFFGAKADQPVNGDIADCGGDGGHGTHNASYAAGARYGVAKGARVYVAKASGSVGCNSDPDSMRHAVNYITNNHPRGVVNISFTGFNDAALQTAVRHSMNAGFVYALAAACTDSTGWQILAAEHRALVVAAVDESLSPSKAINYGPNLSLFAPGAHVLGAGNRNTTEASVQRPLDNHTCTDSFAAPHVAGAAALYLERHPGASPQQVHDALVGGAIVDALSGTGSSPNRLLRLVY
jgi:aqualysin 1